MIEDLSDVEAMRAALENSAEAAGNARLDGRPGTSPAGLLAHNVFRFSELTDLSNEARMTVLAYMVCTRLERDMDVINWLQAEAKASHRLVPVVGHIDVH